MMLLDHTLHELHDQLQRRDITSADLVNEAFAQIETTDDRVKAFLRHDKESALAQAAAVDARFDNGENLPVLAGIPYALKDNISYRGRKLTCSSKMLENYVAPYDATVVTRLKENHAVLVGQLNMDEFAMGSSTENSAFFTTRNPWDCDYVPGGSSGGSASAVAARQVAYSLGSDTGGSIRQPAAFCNLVGSKPTYGSVSRYGLVAFGSSLDQIGPFTKDVKDNAEVLRVISGHDVRDSTSATRPIPDYVKGLTGDVKGLKIGVPSSLMTPDFDPKILEAVHTALDTYKKMGATVHTIEMPSFEAALSTYYLLAPAEVSSNLSRLDGVRYTHRDKTANSLREMIINSRGEGLGSEVRRRIILGTFALSAGSYQAYYQKAQQMRTLVCNDFNRVFSEVDVILSPTTPTPPFKVGSVSDPLTMYLNDLGTIPANIGGVPAISIPCGFIGHLPIGLHLMTQKFDEMTMLNAAFAYEATTDFRLKKPTLAGGQA